MIILPLVLLICALSASNSFLYFKWVGSESQIAVLKLNVQLIQQQLDQQLLLIETLKSSVHLSVAQAVKQEASFDYTYLLGLAGVVSVAVLLFLLFSNNRGGPIIDLAREMTSQNQTVADITKNFHNIGAESTAQQFEALAKLIKNLNNLSGETLTNQLSCIIESIGSQNDSLVELIRSDRIIGGKEILNALNMSHLNDQCVSEKLHLIESLLRQIIGTNPEVLNNNISLASFLANVPFG
jgi:hypothetical protein